MPRTDVSARTFTLPRVLSAQCANFISGNSMLENGISHRRSVRILPSEFWAFRKELEAWRDYPERYTYVAAQVASCLGEAGDCGFRKWIVSISPRFGIVIDTAMSDHLFLLLKLCLKAVWREALASLDLLAGNNGCLDPRSLYLKCPCLSQTLGWLASQLSILYGEINAKSLAISMIAESLTRAGSRFLLFHLDKWSTSAEIRGLREETHGSKLDVNAGERDAESVSSKDNGCASDLEKLCSGQVFVSQIAAAVAALHERALLEDRVNQLRLPKPLSKYQLYAQEERARRPNYRPILDNDGLLWKKTHNQDMTKMKTREELLAEERDYKRRRMSYRGRKVKRTTTQVIRDIIEGHMQEITDAGGIGCHVKGSADSEMPSSRSSHEVEAAAEDVARYESEPSGVSVRDSTVDKKARYLEFDLTAGMAEDARHRDRCITQASRHIVHGNQVNSGEAFV
ncbi:unnamed protein product [Spirodela intermedia]|uniref:HMG box domain-containing protein n=1 Tax=Spirodela intermedia TaxID=51605 RepID=A0A7I8IPG2_SPIIN|nr:unnamed protein product [Spirodela intermedia]CAA6659857.1 unnamed protein product [Spirodela intermedia]